jgi:tungstate transport system substrate-binding protein
MCFRTIRSREETGFVRKYPHSFTGEIMKRLILAISLTLLGAQAQISRQVMLVDHDLATLENSGLLKAILPDFEAKTHMKVHVISVGTGKALELAKNGRRGCDLGAQRGGG